MPKIDKLIVTNVTALRGKYGTAGVRAIRRAVAGLIRSDRRRGLVSRLLDLGSHAAMDAIGGPQVTHAPSPRENKAAIDAAYQHFVPDYLLILGSIDVVPHQDLANPARSRRRRRAARLRRPALCVRRALQPAHRRLPRADAGRRTAAGHHGRAEPSLPARAPADGGPVPDASARGLPGLLRPQREGVARVDRAQPAHAHRLGRRPEALAA